MSACGKTASEFFTDEKSAKYLLKREMELTGDRQLFESELKRSTKSKVNIIH